MSECAFPFGTISQTYAVNHESRDIHSRSSTLSYFLKVKRISFNDQRWKACCIYEKGQKKDAVAQADLSVPPCSKNVYNV